MKSLQSVILVAVLAVGTAQTASAQENNGSQCPPGMIPGVRYTTGAVTTAGWERTLTQNDPNLARWNWSAMTSYTQSSYGKVAPGHYVNQTARPAGGIYTKPVHINPETYAKKRLNPPPIQVARRNYSTADVSARVSFKRPVTAMANPVTAKSYNLNYTNVGGRLVAGNGSDRQDVYGKLMTQ